MKKVIFKIFIILLITSSCQTENKVNDTQQTKEHDKVIRIDSLIKEYKKNRGFSGSILIAQNGKIIYKDGIGMANRELNVPNKPNTKHRIGSLTKQFTAMIILKLVEENKIKLNETINYYIPDYPKKGGDKITIHHLLTHSSGIPRFRLKKYRDPYTPDELLALWDDSELDFDPGTKFTYSNPGYFLLGVIAEKVTRKPYEQILQEYILNPLSMTNSGYDHHKTILKNRSSGYLKQGTDYENAGYTDMSVSFAAGAMYSTVEDLYLWDQALYSDNIISKKYRDLLFTSYIPALGRFYGYGWFNSKYPIGSTKDSIDVLEHSGGIQGYSTRITRIPEDKNLIIILSNVQGTQTRPLTYAINGILYNKPYENPKSSLADAISDIITQKGIIDAIAFFEQHKSSNKFDINEGEINNLGYHFARREKFTVAFEIFKMNTELFAESSNTYDSLGEICVMLGKKNEAIKSYKKSIVLNPNNTNGIKMLKKLEGSIHP